MKYAILSLVFLLLLQSCSANNSKEEQATSCSPTEGQNPESIADSINLINSLNKPVTLDCFLNSLQAPLKVFAVNNTFSAQPAQGTQNPRIFILKNKLVLSIVPSGTGKDLLELGESYSGQSFKAEIKFPVNSTVTIEQISEQLSKGGNTSTCVTCHTSETKMYYNNTSRLFISNFIRPNESQRVQQSYMKSQAETCNEDTNKFRCDMLKAIYIKGQASDDVFPY
ncbi:MAG: hypothetical protein KDD45_08735 [Bdellovibrionales bacterium]|nr:hypothetical protein [Bdellovibrionales bacterium]